MFQNLWISIMFMLVPLRSSMILEQGNMKILIEGKRYFGIKFDYKQYNKKLQRSGKKSIRW